MFSKTCKAALSASALVLTTAAVSSPADAEQRRRGAQSAPEVGASASTRGSGGGGQVTLNGTADAESTNGGSVETRVRGRTTDRRGIITSAARARDEDERARSRSRTIVTPRGDVRTRTHNVYHQQGSRPVITRTRTRTPGN